MGVTDYYFMTIREKARAQRWDVYSAYNDDDDDDSDGYVTIVLYNLCLRASEYIVRYNILLQHWFN